MKTIEKITRDGDAQTFEIITSKKELAKWLKSALCDSIYGQYANNMHQDGDSTMYYYNKDGNFFSITEGATVKRPNVAKIEKLIQNNDSTTVIYGYAPIVYNEHYGDWEVDFD